MNISMYVLIPPPPFPSWSAMLAFSQFGYYRIKPLFICNVIASSVGYFHLHHKRYLDNCQLSKPFESGLRNPLVISGKKKNWKLLFLLRSVKSIIRFFFFPKNYVPWGYRPIPNVATLYPPSNIGNRLIGSWKFA